MSHSTVLVVIDGSVPEEELEEAVAEALDPFDENKEMEPYVKLTRAEAIAEERRDILAYKDGIYAKYLADPAGYAAECRGNPGHLAYLAGPMPGAVAVKDDDAPSFPEKLARIDDDEFLYKLATRWCEPDEIDADGGLLSTYNPKSKWDWYSIGGRWSNMLNRTNADDDMSWNGSNHLRRRDLRRPQSTFAYLANGEWVERGRMGWFGMVSDEQEQGSWDRDFADWLLTVPGDDWLVVVDVHI